MATKNTSSKLTLIMTGIVLLGFAVILAMNVASMLGVLPAKYLSLNDVSGIEVEHNGKPYTLNFAQQNELIDIFNRSNPISKEAFEKRKVQKDLPKVTKIVIYTLNNKQLNIVPIGYVSKSQSTIQNTDSPTSSDVNFVYSSPEWNKDGYLEESSANEISSLLQSAYDH